MNRLGKMSHRGKEGIKEEHEKKLRRSCGNTETAGEAWFTDDSLKVAMSWLLNTTTAEQWRWALTV
jgi:hypothetical protein